MSFLQKKGLFDWVSNQKLSSLFSEPAYNDASLTDHQIWAVYDEQIVASRTIAQHVEVETFTSTYEPSDYLPLIWQVEGQEANQTGPDAIKQKTFDGSSETSDAANIVACFIERANPVFVCGFPPFNKVLKTELADILPTFDPIETIRLEWITAMNSGGPEAMALFTERHPALAIEWADSPFAVCAEPEPQPQPEPLPPATELFGVGLATCLFG
jgi:hypothetical protein